MKGIYWRTLAFKKSVIYLTKVNRIPLSVIFRISAVTEDENLIPEDSLNSVSAKPDSEPRLIKTHLSFDMLPNSIIEENSAIKVGKWFSNL